MWNPVFCHHREKSEFLPDPVLGSETAGGLGQATEGEFSLKKKLFCVAHFPLFGISFTCLNVHFEVAWVVFANVAVNRNLTNWEVGIWTIYIYKNNEINLDKSNAKTYCQDFLRNLRNSWHCFPRVPDGHLHFPDFRHLPPFSQCGLQIPKRNRKYIFTQKWCFYIFVFSCSCFKVKNVSLHFFLILHF